MYLAFDVADGEAAVALAAMRVLGIAGMSVTMPHKRAVADLVDRLEPAARALRSVNTVRWDGDDLVGSSTDGAGFVASLVEVGIDVTDARGRGDRRGRRRPLGDRRAGPGRRHRHHRAQSDREHAELAATFAAAASVGIASDVRRADIVVNATNVGMGVGEQRRRRCRCDPACCEPSRWSSTSSTTRSGPPGSAAGIGAPIVDGLGMLIHQAALQQERGSANDRTRW